MTALTVALAAGLFTVAGAAPHTVLTGERPTPPRHTHS